VTSNVQLILGKRFKIFTGKLKIFEERTITLYFTKIATLQDTDMTLL